MTDEKIDGILAVYAEWATGFSEEGLQRVLADQAAIQRGRLRDGDEYPRYAPNQPSKRGYDTIRAERDDLDYREWNEETGFNGVNRWPTGPGVTGPPGPGARSEGQRRRQRRRRELEEGF